jgi:hypothetical protein
MTNNEQIAASWIFDRLPGTQILPFERLASLFRDNLLVPRNERCHCDPSAKVQKFPIIYPIFPTEGEASKGLYSSIPFAYISWLIPSNALPRIEVIETPIIFPKIIFQAQDKDDIDTKLFPQGRAIIGSFRKVTSPIPHEELKIIRKRVLSKILELSESDAHIYLSIFSEMPKILVEDGVSRYQKGFEVPQNTDSWEFQSQRVMPIVLHKKLFVFALNCWVLTKKDLNI